MCRCTFAPRLKLERVVSVVARAMSGTGTPDGTEGGREVTDDGGGAIQVCTAGGGAAVQVSAMLILTKRISIPKFRIEWQNCQPGAPFME